MDTLFAPMWEDSPCIYCNTPVGSDGETDDGEFYSCAICRESIQRERERIEGMYVLAKVKRSNLNGATEEITAALQNLARVG